MRAHRRLLCLVALVVTSVVAAGPASAGSAAPVTRLLGSGESVEIVAKSVGTLTGRLTNRVFAWGVTGESFRGASVSETSTYYNDRLVEDSGTIHTARGRTYQYSIAYRWRGNRVHSVKLTVSGGILRPKTQRRVFYVES